MVKAKQLKFEDLFKMGIFAVKCKTVKIPKKNTRNMFDNIYSSNL